MLYRHVLAFYLSIVSLGSHLAMAEDWTLESALAAAELHSPTVDRVEATLEVARLARCEMISRLGPSVSVGASYTLNDQEVTTTLPAGVNAMGQPITQEVVIVPEEQRSTSLTVTMPLFDPPSYLAIRQSFQHLSATRADVDDQKSMFRLVVAGAYLDVVVADARYQVAQQDLEVVDQRWQQIQARADVGRERHSAVLRAESEKLAAAASTTAAKIQAEANRKILAIYLGQEITGNLKDIAAPPNFLATSEMIEGTPAVQAARARREVAAASRTQSWSSLLPRVDGRIVYNLADETFQNPDGESWAASVNGSWTLFNSGGRTLAGIKAGANLDVAEAAYREVVEKTTRDIFSAQAAAQAASEQVVVAEARVKVAEAAAAETLADYDVGAALLVDVQAADVALAQARMARVEAQAALARASLSLAHLSGRL